MTGNLSTFEILGFMLPYLFLMLGDQNIYQRLASSTGKESAKTGLIGLSVGLFLVYPAIAFIATVARSVFPDIAPGMALDCDDDVDADFFRWNHVGSGGRFYRNHWKFILAVRFNIDGL